MQEYVRVYKFYTCMYTSLCACDGGNDNKFDQNGGVYLTGCGVVGEFSEGASQ